MSVLPVSSAVPGSSPLVTLVIERVSTQMDDRPVNPPRGRYVLLAVDDNVDNLMILVHVARELGLNVVKGLTGSDALMLASLLQPDLILLEITLPDIDGFTVLQKLRAQRQTQHVPVIAVTALAFESDREQVAEAGFDGYLAKPYMIEELKTTIYRYLEGFSSSS